MELTKQEGKLRKCEKSTAETFGSLALALFATSFSVGERLHTITLIVAGSLFALSWLYLVLPRVWGKSWFLKQVVEKRTIVLLKYFGWFLVLATFGIILVQSEIVWLKVLGILFALVALCVLFFGMLRTGKKARS